MIQYTNDDHAARNWQDAAQMVAKGEAAMNVMGDWVKGYFTTDLKLKPNKDFGWSPTPDTEGTFMVITDTFGLPKGAKNPEATKAFLKVLGSVEGQDVFNPLKGSIPARVDADVNKYDEYGKQTIEDFKKQSADAQFGPWFRGLGRILDGGEQHRQHLCFPGKCGSGRKVHETGGNLQRDREMNGSGSVMGGGGRELGGRGVRRGHLPIAALRHALFNALAREKRRRASLLEGRCRLLFYGGDAEPAEPAARCPGIFTKLRGEKE